MPEWKASWHPARLEERLSDGAVRCHLSPRNCTLKEGQNGFCGVRGNRHGRLVTMNYGKSVHVTEETIETEAVNHYSPGERILSLGNIGCMLNCSYCHNWKTSQAKYVEDRDVYQYTPEGVIEIAQRHGIRCLSWTYNDPVVWHEFVRETAKLAQQSGLINLYKSAFFITPEAIDELIPYMDIFSISIKSIEPEYYKKYTSGWLQPVLDGCKQVFRAGRHVEVSNLMITDISDGEESARRITDWVLTDLDANVPLHFVRFHPDYKMRDSVRTPIPRIVRAREIALEMGMEHVYVGNVYDTPWSDTYCRVCDALLVTRYGLNAKIVGLDGDGNCSKCGRNAHFKLLPAHDRKQRPSFAGADVPPEHEVVQSLDWHGDIRSAHVQMLNGDSAPVHVYHRRRHSDAYFDAWKAIVLNPGESYRFIMAKSRASEVGPQIAAPQSVRVQLHEVFDRAHFPTVSIDQGASETDIAPLPAFPGKQLTVLKSSAVNAARAAGKPA